MTSDEQRLRATLARARRAALQAYERGDIKGMNREKAKARRTRGVLMRKYPGDVR